MLDVVIVAHQGTDPENLYVGHQSAGSLLVRGRNLIANVTPSESILIDLDFPKEKLDQNMFPGIDSSIEVHTGFGDAHARSVSTVVHAQDFYIHRSLMTGRHHKYCPLYRRF